MVKHPVRRRIIMWLMFLGNAGIITVVSSLVLTFISPSSIENGLFRLLYLSIGLTVLWLFAINKAFNRVLTSLVVKALCLWTDLDLHDYASLLHLSGEYQVMEIAVDNENWLTNKKLKEVQLKKEGVAVLGIKRSDDGYLGAPHGDTYIYSGDTLILYGRKTALMELSNRQEGKLGEQAHQQAIANHQQIEQEESLIKDL